MKRWTALALAALLGVGCGSHLSKAEHEAASRQAVVGRAQLAVRPSDGRAPSTATASAAGTELPGDSPSPVTAPAGGATARPAAGSQDPSRGPTATPGQPARAGEVTRPGPGGQPGRPSGPHSPDSAASAAPVAPTSPKAEIVLGSFGTGSGPIGANVAEIPIASRAWMADVNARGGLDGHPVRIVYGDDGGDPARAVALARRMVEQDKIVAFFAVFGPTTLQAVIPYAEQVKIPVVGSTSSQAVEDESTFVFNPQTSLDAIGNAFLATVTTQTPARKIGIVYCREVQGCKAVRDSVVGYAPKAGAKIVYEAQISLAQPDFTAEVVSARQAGTEDIIVVADVQTLIRLIRSAKRQNWTPQFSGSYAFDSPIVKQGGADVEGLIAFSTTANFQASPAMEPYRAAVARYVPGGQVSGPGGQAWAQGKLLEKVAPAFVAAADPARLVAALEAVQGETLGGIVAPVSFSHGPHRDANRCFFPTRFRDGRWTMPLGDRPVCV